MNQINDPQIDAVLNQGPRRAPIVRGVFLRVTDIDPVGSPIMLTSSGVNNQFIQDKVTLGFLLNLEKALYTLTIPRKVQRFPITVPEALFCASPIAS